MIILFKNKSGMDFLPNVQYFADKLIVLIFEVAEMICLNGFHLRIHIQYYTTNEIKTLRVLFINNNIVQILSLSSKKYTAFLNHGNNSMYSTFFTVILSINVITSVIICS